MGELMYTTKPLTEWRYIPGTLIEWRLEFKFVGLWVGAFWTEEGLWICLLPCLPIHFRQELIRVPKGRGKLEDADIFALNMAFMAIAGSHVFAGAIHGVLTTHLEMFHLIAAITLAYGLFLLIVALKERQE